MTRMIFWRCVVVAYAIIAIAFEATAFAAQTQTRLRDGSLEFSIAGGGGTTEFLMNPDGTLKFPDGQSVVCDDAHLGTLRWNADPNALRFEGCGKVDGDNRWRQLGPPDVRRVENSCDDPGCFVTCPPGYKASGGGYNSYWGENVDYNGPSDEQASGWSVYDGSWAENEIPDNTHGPVTVFAVCVSTY